MLYAIAQITCRTIRRPCSNSGMAA